MKRDPQFLDAELSVFPPAFPLVVDAVPADRAAFIRRTYSHLSGAILAFTVLEAIAQQTGLPAFGLKFLGVSWFAWLMVMAGFTAIARIAEAWADSNMSRHQQYLGLGVYVLAEALLFAPLLRLAQYYWGTAVIYSAALLTLMLFTGLTVAVFAIQLDFDWIQAAFYLGGFLAFGLIVCTIVLGFQFGVIISAATILLGAGSIVYQTSSVMNRYRTDQHVAASLALFAAIALLFWYVVRVFIWLRSRRRSEATS